MRPWPLEPRMRLSAPGAIAPALFALSKESDAVVGTVARRAAIAVQLALPFDMLHVELRSIREARQARRLAQALPEEPDWALAADILSMIAVELHLARQHAMRTEASCPRP